MNGAAADFDAVIERLFLRLQSGKRRKQRRDEYSEYAAETAAQTRGKQAHVAGQAGELDRVPLSATTTSRSCSSRGLPLEGITSAASLRSACDLNAGRVAAIGNHHRNARVRDAAGVHRIGDGHEIRSAAAEQNA